MLHNVRWLLEIYYKFEYFLGYKHFFLAISGSFNKCFVPFTISGHFCAEKKRKQLHIMLMVLTLHPKRSHLTGGIGQVRSLNGADGVTLPLL